MYCLFLLCVSLYISLPHSCVCQAVEDRPLDRIIQDYFKSESLRQLKKEWEPVRKLFEHSLVTSMTENIKSPGMNVFIRNLSEKKIAGGYLHNDNQVRVIFSDLELEAIPNCINPDVKLALGSNVLKLHASLSDIIIHADYVLIRNKSDVIHDPKDQDPFKSSPFLFEPVQDVGKVAITMQGCEFKGFITLELDIEEIDLGHDRFKIFDCMYTIDIYRPGDEAPPVIARYNMSYYHDSLGLTDLLKKPLLTNSLLPKLQMSLYTFVNTTDIFGESGIQQYRQNLETVLIVTENELAEVVRQMNKLTVEKNHGAIKMADYEVHWDDGRIKRSKKNEAGTGESLSLTEMVLTGLDTLYSAHKGGPFEFDTIRIAEKLRFSSLQVRGKLEIRSTWSDTFDFAAEITDLAMDLQIELSEINNISNPDTWIKDRKLEVEGMREITFTVPSLIFGSAESLIGGYLLNEVPKLINAHSTAMFDQAMQRSKTKPPNQVIPDAGENKNEGYDLMLTSDYLHSGELEKGTLNSDSSSQEEIKGVRERNTLKKSKKRLISVKHPRRRRRGRRGPRGRTLGKRVAKNEIRNK